ncbi:MAG: AbrB/MazE/SpoVT family DNA-binding domain-containing protein [Methanobrevibacter sp.]|nr:AbrB/MazE/SpoVT family DNA-binding domain-containing protein [Methanobrevibacter sp.]
MSMLKYKNIKYNKYKHKGMRLMYSSKVQQHGGSKIVSIPKTIVDLLEIEKGDSMIWELNLEDKTLSVKKKEK